MGARLADGELDAGNDGMGVGESDGATVTVGVGDSVIVALGEGLGESVGVGVGVGPGLARIPSELSSSTRAGTGISCAKSGAKGGGVRAELESGTLGMPRRVIGARECLCFLPLAWATPPKPDATINKATSKAVARLCDLARLR